MTGVQKCALPIFGGHDLSVISGRRVLIQTANGTVNGVTGKRAIHLMDDEDRKKVPKKHEIWIDIGARDKADALSRVEIGDVATYDHELELINGSIGTARAFDNKVGAYVEAGAAYVILAMRAPFDRDGLERFAAEVIPAVRG